MIKKLSLIFNKKNLPIFSAVLVASLIFTIFISNQKDTNNRQPIFSKHTLDDVDTPKSEIGYKKKKPEYVEGQILVKYKEDDIELTSSKGENKAKEIRESKSVKKIKSIKSINTELVEITDGKSVKDKIKELKNDPDVEYAEPNYIAYPSYSPNDPEYNLQWALENTGQFVVDLAGTTDADMDVSEMWDIEEDHGSDIVVAVIDSGVAINHPDISANLIQGYNAITDGATEPYDVHGHGTHVTGVIVGAVNNSSGISGISLRDNVKVMPIAAQEEDGTYSYEGLIESTIYAKEHGADIINFSLGGPSNSDIFKGVLADFPGLIIVAAGNNSKDNDTSPDYPASFDLPNIVSIAATNQNDELAYFSNYGATTVDVAAPGTNILSAEGYRVLDEDFELVVAPGLGKYFTQLGVETNWGTYQSADMGFLLTDIGVVGSGSYAANADSYITSSSVNIESTSYLGFYYECNLPLVTSPTSDYLAFEVYNGSTWNEIFRINTEGHGEFEADITQYGAPNSMIRFHWHTDASDNEYIGCIIDDIKIVDSSSSQGSYQYMDGTSMACPYASAVAAMIWGKNPSLSAEQVKAILLQTGDSVDSLSGTTLTGKRINAYQAYSANPSDYGPEEPTPGTGDEDPTSTKVVFHPDRRCHWEKPGNPTWIKLEPKEENGVKGMLLTWAQYDADKINIKIDDGTGNYPWKVEKTLNDGHEFLPNVSSWQNIMVKPINHCREGEYSAAVSQLAYPYGWYEKSSAKLASNTNTLGYSTKSSSAVLGTTTETEETPQEETPMVPETGSNDLVFLTSSLAIVGFAAYFILDDRSRKIALRGFEKKSSKNI